MKDKDDSKTSRKRYYIPRGTKVAALVVLLLALMATYIIRCVYAPRERVQQNLVRVEAYTEYQILQDGKVVLNFDQDTVVGIGCFANKWFLLPTCEGRMMVNIDSTIWTNRYKNVDPQVLLQARGDSLDSVYRETKWNVAELDYYLQSHQVTDEGFNMVSQYAQQETLKRDSAKKMLDSLSHIRKGKHLKIIHKQTLVAILSNKQKAALKKLDFPFFQLMPEKTPKGIRPLSPQQAADLVGIDAKPLSKSPLLYLHPDSTSNYQGQTDSLGVPQGHGKYWSLNGNYYEGYWKNGKRDGFGFSVSPKKPLRVGEWRNDAYKGERLVYTSERIYGIDISKYQHIAGKKKYAIDWSRLRITNLGKISKKAIAGNVNYPISFIYVKSTEGATLLNPYYRKDYLAARAHGYKVGSYHFFSPLSPAPLQARQFLKHTMLRKDDFPPVLDVEPTKEQIKKMGGTSVLFAHVRTWLRMVERATGVKPILYISQTFVNRYLSLAPDLKQNYQIWIARYGEYKPDIRLVYWQLCPDGRVAGIHGAVDINVFNGYNDAYDQFVQQHTK